MYTTLILSTLSALTIASPLVKRQASEPDSASSWTAAPGFKTTCDTSSDKVINLSAGAELDTLINDACAAMMPPCAYQDRLPAGTACILPTTWPLSGPVESKQSAKTKSAQGSEETESKVKFSVTPAQQPEGSAGVFWSKEECYGYFAQVLEKQESEGGCHSDKGLGLGKITAGGDTSLKDTVFEVSIAAAE
ncbi:hypothetical protein HBI56_131010 [Parastagonospora nodorum]|nr:hypothetical protein HBI10_152930 [Parastagonospora nodorum]KAH4012535.1 hypothetical protein HBI13_187620 [Parastagonospora nodorum]KAH4029544.1 hypothetical protein HBI09_134740 [Parastagonospora nodorum]KAH4164928.1 hypothetical protein HBH43_147340 [Parastagonospora nodorum]KAH4257020.1 hypothetical protein HBI03_159950 [Parastagonospora nodorum]